MEDYLILYAVIGQTVYFVHPPPQATVLCLWAYLRTLELSLDERRTQFLQLKPADLKDSRELSPQPLLSPLQASPSSVG